MTQFYGASYNVYITLVLCMIWGLADSIWTGAVLAAWIYKLAGGDSSSDSDHNKKHHPNSEVGMIEAIQGLASLFTALPVGYLADKYGRGPVCKVGGFGFLVAVAISVYAVTADVSTHQGLVLLTIAMGIWGICGGIFNGPVQALFADSIPQGDRSYWYSLLMGAYTLPSVAGPGIAILLFQLYDDAWTLDEMRPVLLTGLLLEIPAALLSMFLRDSWALPEEVESVDESANLDVEDDAMSMTDENGLKVSYIFGYRIDKESIPYMLFAGDLLTAIGSGMTVKFFPLFFKNEIHMGPSAVQGIYMVVPVVMVLFTMIAQRISLTFGRLQTIIFAKTVGIASLVFLAMLEYKQLRNWVVLVPLYVFRTAIMNCTYPLDESVLMDNVPKETRARWKSLESVSIFGWCGSAFLGGILADKFSYNFSFIITAIFQFSGVLLLVVLIPVVEDERPRLSNFTASPAPISNLEDRLLATEHEDDTDSIIFEN